MVTTGHDTLASKVDGKACFPHTVPPRRRTHKPVSLDEGLPAWRELLLFYIMYIINIQYNSFFHKKDQ
jgi:hypothetical protein